MKKVFLAVLLLFVIGGGIFLFLKPPPVGVDLPNDGQIPPDPDLTVEELQEVSRLRNLGIAFLENAKRDESGTAFEKLLTLVPNERLPLRNYAIGETLSFLDESSQPGDERFNARLKSAQDAIQAYLEFASEDAVAYRLQARVAAKLGNYEQANAALEKADQYDPGNPNIQYEIYNNSLPSRDPEVVKDGLRALNQLHELAPENVFATIKWMQAKILQETPDIEDLKSVVAEAKERLSPLAPGVSERKKFDITTLIDQASSGAESNDPMQIKRGLLPLGNFLVGDDVALRDSARLDDHPLEFVQFRFSDDFEAFLGSLSVTMASPEAISFTESIQLPELSAAVKCLQIADIDLDGKREVLALTSKSLDILKMQAGGWQLQTSYPTPREFEHFVLADLDYDRKKQRVADKDRATKLQHVVDLDLVLYGETGIAVIQNQLDNIGGAVTFEQMTGDVLSSIRNVTSVVASDLNSDADLDLVLIADGEIFYLNNHGNFQFQRRDLDAEFSLDGMAACAVVDFDQDIDLDVLFVKTNGEIGVFENYRHATFRGTKLDQQFDSGRPRQMNIIDADRNGSWDVLISGESGVELFTTLLPERGNVVLGNKAKVSKSTADLLLDVDLDNDGFRDFFVLNAEQVSILQAIDGINYSEMGMNFDAAAPVAIAAGDIDHDGDDDLLAASGQQISLLINDAENVNNWIEVSPVADIVEGKGGGNSQKINYYGVGNTIQVRAGETFLQQLAFGQSIRFGLGKQESVDAARIIWTNGVPQNIVQPDVRQAWFLEQKLLGSCPYLYAWNGEEFIFVTDLLWAAPIGLPSPQGGLVPTRDWEYLKVPGELLQPKDGKYVLQVTEELWETAYFDQVELIAIDHPADVDIYTNEKVGPPSVSEHKIYQVREKRLPVSVKNQLDQDLMPEVKQQDERYARPFTEKLMQGYTDDSFVEIDFGLQERPKHLTLFLTGWIFPTDSAINVALQENSRLPGPKPPSISVPDADGHFVEVIPFCGFPGGKTKTIAIDLADAFITEDYRIRLETSMELYWDHIFFSTENLTEEYVSQRLICEHADLHYRGLSRKQLRPNNAPKKFLYNEVYQIPSWPAIEGKFTRYGDVLELIQESDHQLVVMGAGDEMTLTFAASENPIPQGWKRDFVLHNIGWDKDANLHTVTGHRVEPLPYVGMDSYPGFDPTQAPHPAEYLQKYQTREVDLDEFRSVLRRYSPDELEATRLKQSNE